MKQGVDAGTAASIVDSQLIPAISKSGGAIDNTNQGRKNMISDLTAMGLNAGTAKTDTDNLATAIVNHGVKSSQEAGARAQLITDLTNAGMSAQDAAGYVDGLIGKLAKVKSPPPVNIDVTTTFKTIGSPTNAANKVAANQQAITHDLINPGGALGGLVTPYGILRLDVGGPVPGTGTGDTVPALLTPGERVLSVPQVAKMGGHQAITRLAAGGAVGGPAQVAVNVSGQKLTSEAKQAAKDVGDEWAKSGARWFSAAQTSVKTNVANPLTALAGTTIPAAFAKSVGTWYTGHAAALKTQVQGPVTQLAGTTIPAAWNQAVPHWYDTHASTLSSKVTTPVTELVDTTIPGLQNKAVPTWYNTHAATLQSKVTTPLTQLIDTTIPGAQNKAVPTWYNTHPATLQPRSPPPSPP